MEKRFGFLRAVSILLKILAVLAIILAVVGAVLAFTNLGSNVSVPVTSGTGTRTVVVQTGSPAVAAVGVLITGAITAFMLMVYANTIDLTLAVEENTRATAILMRKMIETQRNQF